MSNVDCTVRSGCIPSDSFESRTVLEKYAAVDDAPRDDHDSGEFEAELPQANLSTNADVVAHRDYANLDSGWCTFPALGELTAAMNGPGVTFPEGTVLSIPSNAMTHLNVGMGEQKSCLATTQYQPGHLSQVVQEPLPWLPSSTTENL